ncbi:MAG: sulfotransferase family 2 domain-containing protein [Acidimicrobiia bacterium]
MAVVSRDHGFLFIQNPRTASTAMGEGLLMPRLGAEFVGTPPSHETAGDKHASASELVRRGLLTTDELDRLYVFGAIRNPYDSLVSLYEKMSGSYAALVDDPTSWVHKQPAYLASMRVAREADFSEWAIFHLTRRPAWQLPVAAFSRGRVVGDRFLRLDRLLRFETLQADFDAAMDDLGLGRLEIPRLNVTDRDRAYRPRYSTRARWLARRAYRNYETAFGYTF